MSDDIGDSARGPKRGQLLFAVGFLAVAALLAGLLWDQTAWKDGKDWFSQPRFWPAVGVFGMVGFTALHLWHLPRKRFTRPDWVEGRNWQFELDDRYFDRRAPDLDDPHPDFAATGAAEYFAKKHFMARFVRLLHRIGAPEFARQYEWWTAKSQPNVLKRLDAGDGPSDGLTAIDFRAGLALLPFLPMSPADVPLIWRGLRRGALVQFDRGDLGQLETYIDEHAEKFDDLRQDFASVLPLHGQRQLRIE